MILKVKACGSEEPNGWTIMDNISRFNVYHDEILHENRARLVFSNGTPEMIVSITEVCYLCNDNGKTIERLYPYDESDRELK